MKANNLPFPFNTAFDRGDSIDYRCAGADHDYVRKLGYEPEMNGDCSYSAPELKGFSLSSYGDWGTFYPSWADEKERDMFLDMFEQNIIQLWRIRAYVEHVTHDYADGEWKKYDKELKTWVNCPCPY